MLLVCLGQQRPGVGSGDGEAEGADVYMPPEALRSALHIHEEGEVCVCVDMCGWVCEGECYSWRLRAVDARKRRPSLRGGRGGGGVVGGWGGGRRRKRARNAHACGMEKSKQATEQGLGMIVGKMGKQGV